MKLAEMLKKEYYSLINIKKYIMLFLLAFFHLLYLFFSLFYQIIYQAYCRTCYYISQERIKILSFHINNKDKEENCLYFKK